MLEPNTKVFEAPVYEEFSLSNDPLLTSNSFSERSILIKSSDSPLNKTSFGAGENQIKDFELCPENNSKDVFETINLKKGIKTSEELCLNSLEKESESVHECWNVETKTKMVKESNGENWKDVDVVNPTWKDELKKEIKLNEETNIYHPSEKQIKNKEPKITNEKEKSSLSHKNKNLQKDESPSPTLTQKYLVTECECCFETMNKKWEDAILKITKTKLSIGSVCIEFEKILKIKIFPAEKHHPGMSNSLEGRSSVGDSKIKFKKNVLKISTEENSYQYYQVFPEIILNQPKTAYSISTIPNSESIGASSLPLPFVTLSKIIIRKLRQLYPSTKWTEWESPTFNCRPLIHNGPSIKNYAFIHGTIYKKSQHKGNWEKRYIIINGSGVYSYKNEQKENHTFEINANDIKYMWTWFTTLKEDQDQKQLNSLQKINNEKQLSQDAVEKSSKGVARTNSIPDEDHHSFLIVKLKHGFNGQTEFGIPICGFDNEMNKVKNWLYAFYKVLSHYDN